VKTSEQLLKWNFIVMPKIVYSQLKSWFVCDMEIKCENYWYHWSVL